MKRILSVLLTILLLCLCGCGKEPAGDPANPIKGEYAEADTKAKYTFVAEESEYTCYILLTAGDHLTDVRLQMLEPGAYSYSFGEELYTVETMKVGQTLLMGVVYYGDLTTYGISFADSNGNYRNYAVYMRGEDGSLILQEFLP